MGTLPPPRFTTGELKDGDVDFCYGSRDGQLWSILNQIFDLNLAFETTLNAVEQRKRFLVNRQIGICDIVAQADRKKIDASDLGMQNVQLRDLMGYLEQYHSVHTLLFTGGNSKNGPEYFFRRQLKQFGLQLETVNNKVPRLHKFRHKTTGKWIKTVSLTAPSGAANRAVGSLPEYKRMKDEDPEFNTFDFRVLQYQKYF